MDPIARRKTIRMIKDWGRAGKSVIVSSHILHEIESMTSNILLINQGRILAEGNVHQIRDLIDEHPHTVYIKADQPRALAREFLAHDDVLSLRFEEAAVVVQTGRPDAFLRAADRPGRLGRTGGDSRSDVARRQPAGGVPVPGEVMTEPATPTPVAPTLLPSAMRVFDLSLGQMLWSRRSVFLGVLLGGPVLLAVALRVVAALYESGFKINGAQTAGARCSA